MVDPEGAFLQITRTAKRVNRHNNDAVFVFRNLYMGLLGFPNIFVLYQDEQVALIHFCQKELFLFNLEDSLLLSRDQFLYDRNLFHKMDDILLLNGVKSKLIDLNQLKCAKTVSENSGY